MWPAQGENMPQPTLFAFGLKKIVQVNGVRHEVMPTHVLNYEVENPLKCKFECGKRFSRPCARASHERVCKRRKVTLSDSALPPPAVALAPRPAAAEIVGDVEMRGSQEDPEATQPPPQLLDQAPWPQRPPQHAVASLSISGRITPCREGVRARRSMASRGGAEPLLLRRSYFEYGVVLK